MVIKWEKNSRVNRLAAEGKISDEDVIARGSTENFPADAATVRIQNVKAKNPHVVVHIRGKSKPRTMSWNNQTYEMAATCRVTLASQWGSDMRCSNGDLDEDLNWLDVHNIVTRVKEVMEI